MLWFNGQVTALMLVSFVLMVLSSIIAAWTDISSTLNSLSAVWSGADSAIVAEATTAVGVLSRLNVGYLWMFTNCGAAAGYLSSVDLLYNLILTPG